MKKRDNENLRDVAENDARFYTPDDKSDFAYTIVTTNGKPKTLLWSALALLIGFVSVLLCVFGWTGMILGVLAVCTAIFARRFLGFFNGMSISGLILGIFAFVIGTAIVILFAVTGKTVFEFLS